MKDIIKTTNMDSFLQIFLVVLLISVTASSHKAPIPGPRSRPGSGESSREESVTDTLSELQKQLDQLRGDVDFILAQISKDKPSAEYLYAVCKPSPNSFLSESQQHPIDGIIRMRQNASDSNLEIDVALQGFRSRPDSKHGIHVHALGDLRVGCQSTGGHYNPLKQNHGASEAAGRHVGDWGNIAPNNEGTVQKRFSDRLARLTGEHSIIGRAVVIHNGTDDLGLGGNAGSLKTGNAGARLACCVVGHADETSWV